ncbi:MAG: LysM peptidoglycan-binding domain-containing protein [Candidatus Polarisedimenticolaceae bacterium]|nr:LysM peptidoglycan-binding domain-containing protein [Candidatus Polarisedimenticolaceae bacterium]
MPAQLNSRTHTLHSVTKALTLLLLSALLLTACGSAEVRSEASNNEQPAVATSKPEITASPVIEELIEPVRVVDQEPIFSVTTKDEYDIWSRLRQGFRLHQPVRSRIDLEVKWYVNHPDYIARVQERATPLLHFILEEAERRNMPTEVVLLPVVESAFQPFAYSPGRAAGLWQFIPATGRHYGLEQNWWYDGRRDIIASTHAALDFLQHLARSFDGDWELALAAYNSGAGTVGRAIRKNRKQGKATDFWSLKLPRETQGYVPRLLAIAKIIDNPAIYGITLKSIPDQPQIGTVDIGGQLDLALAAEMAEMPIKEIYSFNPAFNRWATAPNGPHHLTLPLEKIPTFQAALAKLDPSKRLRWKRYKIKSGDSLGVIARKHNTTLALLKQVNKIRGNRIRAGKHLLIPVSSKGRRHYAFSSTQRKQKIKNTVRKGTRLTHTVEHGDSLWDIARAHKVSYRKLAKWNGMAPGDTLHLGQELVIWSKSNKTQPTLQIPNFNPTPFNRQNSISYRVRKGDSLARIAQRFNVRVADLRRWNRLPSKYLQPGQKIKLYVDITQQTL